MSISQFSGDQGGDLRVQVALSNPNIREPRLFGEQCVDPVLRTEAEVDDHIRKELAGVPLYFQRPLQLLVCKKCVLSVSLARCQYYPFQRNPYKSCD